MYEQPFFITDPVSNNAFNLEKRPHKKLRVARLKTGTLSDVRLGNEIVFEDFDDDGKLHACTGLEEFIKTTVRGIPVYIFDNHNHAFAFWCAEKAAGNLKDDATLIHIDQHKDRRTPESFIPSEDARDLEKVFRYTNTVLNVGNFIPAAQHIGLVKEIVFLDSQYSLERMMERLKAPWGEDPVIEENVILDIDLDFFAPESDYIGNDLKLDVIARLIPRASAVTFATSPYFIEQERALEYLKRILRPEPRDQGSR